MEQPRFVKRLELSSEERRELLERLNAHAGPPNTKRLRSRHDYNVADIAVSIVHPQGGESRFLVYGRNISRGGMSVFHGGYVHTGSECRIVLPQVEGPPLVVVGEVSHCRLIAGSCHEVGVRFREEIDPRLVTGCAVAIEPAAAAAKGGGRSLRGTILLAEAFEPESRLLETLLSSHNLVVKAVATPGATLDTVQREVIDLVLMGLSPIRDDGLRTIERLRVLGFRAPVLMLTAESDPAVIARARQLGATGIIAKPVTIDLLVAQLKVHLGTGTLPEKLYSTAEDQPEIQPLIGPFVESVRITAEQIDKAYESKDIPYLRDLCCRLKGSGCGYGFQELTVAAISALNTVDLEHMAESRTEKIRELIECGRSLVSGETLDRAA